MRWWNFGALSFLPHFYVSIKVSGARRVGLHCTHDCFSGFIPWHAMAGCGHREFFGRFPLVPHAPRLSLLHGCTVHGLGRARAGFSTVASFSVGGVRWDEWVVMRV